MARVAWQTENADHEIVLTSVVHILVQALELIPYTQLSRPTYGIHVTLLVDLLNSQAAGGTKPVAIAARTARFVLQSTQLLIRRDVGVVTLLQSLEQLARAVPEAFWCSDFLMSAAYFLVEWCETSLEQQLMLRVLRQALSYGREVVAGSRTVYVEILVLPLSSMISVHGAAVSELLQMMMEIKSMSMYNCKDGFENDVHLTETATHARSAIQIVGDEESCQRWLNSLFLSSGAVSTSNAADKWIALLLIALLSDERTAFRDSATRCLERQVNSSPKFWGAVTTKSLVPSLVFLVSQRPSTKAKRASARGFAEWMISCLYCLAALAATTTDTMRVVLRLIDSMNNTAKMRPIALKFMFEVWRNESRVFPRLETMLLEPTSPVDDVGRHIVRMATIKALCEKDPDLGVQFIAPIQAFLEDQLKSVVSMAMDAITALCGGDCLDFYVAFKIIAQKIRKKKVTCAEEPLFLERLCHFYTLGGVNSTTNRKDAMKLLNQTWKFTLSEYANVRKFAYRALCQYPLNLSGLCVIIDESTEHDGDEMSKEEVVERLDDLLVHLQTENDPDVRVEVERLAAEVIRHESTQLTAIVRRGQRIVSAVSWGHRQQQSAQRVRSFAAVSGAATKELKALLPTRVEVESMFAANSTTTDWSGYLLAFQPKALIDTKNVSRKDKLVRLATQNVIELEQTVTIVLQNMGVPWVSVSISPDCDSEYKVFLLIQALMEGWRGFMVTFICSLDELAKLKTPTSVDDADVAFRVFSEGITSLFDLLLNNTSNKEGGAVAAGALAGELCGSRHWQNPQLRLMHETTVKELSHRLALSIEQTRVLSTDTSDTSFSCIGASIAVQLSLDRRSIDAEDSCSNYCIQLDKIKEMFTKLYQTKSDDLLSCCALLGLSRIATLYTSGDEIEAFEVTQWRHEQVKPIAELILESFLNYDNAKRPNKSSTGHGDSVFPLYEMTEARIPLDIIASGFKQPSSSSSTLLRWASLMGLARLSDGFSRIKRVDWLTNLRRVLLSVWEERESANIVAVALGPVLLQSVRFNLLPSSSLETFVATCNRRAAEATVGNADCGFLMMAVANVLCQIHFYGGFPDKTQNQIELAVKHIENALANDGEPGRVGHTMMLSGIANFFHLTFGISGSSVASTLNVGANIELTLDFDTTKTLVQLARQSTRSEGHCTFAKIMLGAIARAADSFYVSQKKKSFDVEIRTLPSSCLLVKTLKWLQQVNHSENDFSHRDGPTTEPISRTRQAVSLICCLTSAGAVLPPFDYAMFLHRIMLRLCSVDTSVACVRFAATQSSCDELLAGELLSGDWFGNANAALQAEVMAWLSTAVARVPTDVLKTLLVTTFDILKEIWRRDTSSSRSTLLFDSWTFMLRNALDSSAHRISDDSLAVVNNFVFEKVVVELPFDVHASRQVEHFATRVLSKLDYGERSVVDAILKLDVVNMSTWSWWRSGVFVTELAKLDVFALSKLEASLIFQWILRHDFVEWTDKYYIDTYLLPLTARIGALVARHTRPDDNVSSLLDVIDTFSRISSSLDVLSRSHISKRRALFAFLACVLSWNSALSHEKYLLETSRINIVSTSSAVALLPFGLAACARSAEKVSTVCERLVTLLRQLARIDAIEVAEYTDVLLICSRQMYVAADRWHIPCTMSGEIRELWSLSDTS
uniref:DUF3730 domain-containing protein n=1 Tax=Hyaloperonospora arabidopsidis (strain Emoy2) TaxID=559515 RepID=M4C295_HYAAE